jgi:hypothetical protein
MKKSELAKIIRDLNTVSNMAQAIENRDSVVMSGKRVTLVNPEWLEAVVEMLSICGDNLLTLLDDSDVILEKEDVAKVSSPLSD